jgi:hypothetical protein
VVPAIRSPDVKRDIIIIVYFTNKCIYTCRSKGKAIPLQAWTGPEASRRLRLPDFKTVGT